MPEGVDWEIFRILTSQRFSVTSPSQILNEWTLEELVDAHLVLDMFEELEARAARP